MDNKQPDMGIKQPEVLPRSCKDFIDDIQRGHIKIPKFQRDFVWSIDKTAQLLDSILKGYPIGTFILWKTSAEMIRIEKIGNQVFDNPLQGMEIEYVLDGQQRITSLYAAYTGAIVKKSKTTKINYEEIYVDLLKDIENEDDQVITHEKSDGLYISLNTILNFTKNVSLIQEKYPEHLEKITRYYSTFLNYNFSTITLRRNDIGSAIEVFTRINTGGQKLTLFEIMSAKTYDEKRGFNMQEKWNAFNKELKSKKYDNIAGAVILNVLALILSDAETKECTRKIKLDLDTDAIIEKWDDAIVAIRESIDYFRTSFQIPVSQLLPYDTLIVPFAYLFHTYGKEINTIQKKYLKEFFWRMSLSVRYSSGAETKLGQDIKRIDKIMKENKRPEYTDIPVIYNFEHIIKRQFRAGNSYCKAVLCLLASLQPKDFATDQLVTIDNSWLSKGNSKNYHHFFPIGHLAKDGKDNENSLANITIVTDHFNKHVIKDKAPSVYIEKLKEKNEMIKENLNTQLIDYESFGIKENNYELFLEERAKLIHEGLESILEPDK